MIKTGDKTFVIAEIGINHNGDVKIAKQLIKAAKECGCDAVKFQKRTVDVVYTKEELEKPRENPFGPTNGDLKRGLEFGYDEYKEIDEYCKECGIMWSASPWDVDSVDFLAQFDVPFYKIASATITDIEMLKKVREKGKTVIVSVGMSSLEEIDRCVEVLGKDNLILLACTSLYPPKYEQLNLNRIKTLKERYNVPVGYSGHETDDFICAVAVGMGACVVERHFTLDRTMWGSDHKASIEPDTMKSLVDKIRKTEAALGTAEIYCMEDEVPVREKLRRVK